MTSLLSVKNLSVFFHDTKVVNDISFALSSKKITALVGESGSGKSTVALAIVDLLRHAKMSGEIVFAGKNLLQLDEKELSKIRGKEIGFIFQDPNTSLNPLHKIGDQISEAIEIHNPKISKKNLQNRVAELLKMVELEGLSSRLNAFPHQLSGGQKQRVMIAIALANNPKILIADEPTTALDVTIQNDILNLILRLKNELNLAVLFITHNLRSVAKIADETIEMKEGRIQQPLSLDQRSKHLEILNSRDPRAFGSRMTDVIMEVKNLSVIHKTKKSFLRKENFYVNRDLNFLLKYGENLGVIGESGSGKSTLALALLNLIPSQGEIKFFGEKNWAKNSFELRSQVQIVFQDPFSSLNPRMMVKDIIAEGLLIHGPRHKAGVTSGEDWVTSEKVGVKIEREVLLGSSHLSFLIYAGIHDAVLEVMKKLYLNPDLQNRYPHQLSGGQRQRVAIARALILNPQILILDEPTSALDYVTQNEILKLLSEIQSQQQISYILISHDLEVVERIAEKIAVLKSGQIIEIDTKSKILNAPQNQYTKSLVELFR